MPIVILRRQIAPFGRTALQKAVQKETSERIYLFISQIKAFSAISYDNLNFFPENQRQLH